jgi:N-acetylglucosamine transport system permease protein
MNKGRGPFIALFLAPATILYAVFVILPLAQSFQYSLYRWHGLSNKATFIGFDNFQHLVTDKVFLQTVQHNLWLLVVAGTLTIVLSLAVAHGIAGQGALSRTLRGVVLFPQMVSIVAVAVLWQFILNPNFGLLTSGLKGLGYQHPPTWLGESATALPSVGMAFIWVSAGFYIMLFSAALRSLPQEVTEAAELDGATGFKRFFQITWPMMWSVKRIAIVHLTITVMNVFVLVLLMTRGGPDRATESMLTYLYDVAFTDSQFGYGAAIGVVCLAIVLTVSLSILWVMRHNPEESRPIKGGGR